MKNIIIFSYFLVLCLGCRQEVLETAPIYLSGEKKYGFAKGLKNNKDFEASAYYFKMPKDTNTLGFKFSTYDDIGILAEDIFILNIPGKKGKYTLNDTDFFRTAIGSFYRTMHDDSVEDEYQIDEDEKSYIRITSIDLIQRKVNGEFCIYYVRKPGEKVYELNPDKVKFSKGVFETTSIK